VVSLPRPLLTAAAGARTIRRPRPVPGVCGGRAMQIYDAGAADNEAGAGPQVPQRPEDLAAHYDLTISHPRADFHRFAPLDCWLAQAAAAHGLSCAVLHEGTAAEAIRRLEAGRLRVGYHLDYFALWHVSGDLYARLSLAVQDAGGRPVNAPARARAFTD